MAPIRLGNWAGIADLSSYAQLTDFKVTAVCNSSAVSARKAITARGLDSTTSAYGNPEDLAADPNVDMIVVSVRVTEHYKLTAPALRYKKQVFVERPLDKDLAESEELTKMAKGAGVNNIVGLQARSDPLVLKVKNLISSGKIGRVTSSTVLASSSLLPIQG